MRGRSRALPPGPPWPSIVQGFAFWTRPLSFLERCRDHYGSRFTIRLPVAPPFVMLTDPEEVKQVHTAPPDVLHPGRGARVLEPVVGNNSVILLDEGRHLEQRKLMLPSFHGEKMERLTGLLTEVTEREIADWPRSETIALHPRMQALTLEVILRAVFGLDPGPRLDALRAPLRDMLRFGDNPLSLIQAPPKGSRRRALTENLPPFSSFVRRQRDADALIIELIRERRASSEDRGDILAMLLEARHADGSPMSDDELRDELMTLLVAGHETTATTLAWFFERLLREPAVLERLRDELDGEDDRYLTAAIQEAMRRRPVIPNNAPRYVAKEIQIGDWTYQPGCCLVPNAYLIHHDPAIYPDPYEFRPERFLDDPPGTYTWIPFGGGRRRCLGASFAMLEMKVVVRAIVRTCELQPAGDEEPARRRNITIRPAAGACVVLRDRERVPLAA
jgi:cytochrome P450